MYKCPADYKIHKASGFCRGCRQALFGGINVSPILDFDTPINISNSQFFENIKQISISGVQTKYSLKLENKKLVLTETNGEYILKPVPSGLFLNLEATPENEHLTMQIANLYGIDTAKNTLVFFKDGGQAYLTKRFDKPAQSPKYLQEDFAQIKQVSSKTNGENYKYEGSYEEIGHLIKKYVAAYQPNIEAFFKQILFNFLFSNGDAHLKNFSLLQSSFGDFNLSPAYDLLNTSIHTPNESFMALDLFANDYFSEAFSKLGFYSQADFKLLAQRLGILESRSDRIINNFKEPKNTVFEMAKKSYLSIDLQNIYTENYTKRLQMLNAEIK